MSLTTNRPLEFLTMLWWLVTFALLADKVKFFEALQDSIEDAKDYYDNDHGFDTSSVDNELAASKCSRAATGLACIVWLLFTVTLGFVGKSAASAWISNTPRHI